MAKLGYIFFLVLGIIIFNSCSNRWDENKNDNSTNIVYKDPTLKKSYGAYLAGRVAHLRRNFNKAADYYIQALNDDPKNQDLISRLYVILASQGRIEEAAKYARQSLKNGDNNNFTYIIIAVEEMKKGQFQNVNTTINKLDGPVYKQFIIPLMSAWAYAGLNDHDKAMKALSGISKEKSFKALYHFHAGMLNDYFDRKDEAQKHYEIIVNEETLEMSFRALQVITNFYLRTGQKDKAVALSQKYNDEKLMADMLRRLDNNVAKADPEKTQKIIDNPNKGMSEALFSIAATLRQGASGIDIAHIFICLSIYSNQDYDLAKLLLADILENREMYEEANEIYEQIPESSEAYYSVQVKKANNLVALQDYPGAELLLKSLALETPNNYQLLLDLGDVLRIRNKQEEAVKYYEYAIKSVPQIESQHWILYYALGISYERSGQWKKAEQNLKTAIDLSQNHYLVLNYLGYSWIKRGENIEEAFGMIVDAYNQSPNDGNIADSLGWAFYILGMYNNAIVYLEKANQMEPANALISDHLGDAYWFGGRRNEARFQWKHALTLEDESGEVDRKATKRKIRDGLSQNKVPDFDKKIIEEHISAIIKE